MSFIFPPVTLQTLFGKKRLIVSPGSSITIQVVISEETNDTLTITKQPVQTGASITDHAYQEPTVFTMTFLQQVGSSNTDIGSNVKNTLDQLRSPFANDGLANLYAGFLDLQSSREPFKVVTPKRIYNNMLLAVLRQNTDKRTENILSLSCTFQQVILVSVGSVQVSPGSQRNAAATQATQNGGNKSALAKGAPTGTPTYTQAGIVQ
jgi:hypothetical protein